MRGFLNNGNTCYISAILQGLFNNKYFVNWIETYATKIQSLKPLTDLFQLYNNVQDTQSCSIKSFIEWISEDKDCYMDLHHQNDAQEFTVMLFNIIINKASIGYASQSQLGISNQKTRNDIPVKVLRLRVKLQEQWKKGLSRVNKDVFSVFHGQCLVQVKCGHCDAIYHMSDMFNVFSLDICPNINSCFSKTINDEYISEDWKCEKCKKTATLKNRAIKSIRFWKLPDMFIISLKRFNNHGKKLIGKVKGISQICEIDMRKYMCGASPYYPKREVRYKCKAVVLHHGAASSGHYTTLINNTTSWIKCDDDQVVDFEKIVEPEIIQSSSYICFLERQ